MNCIQSLLSLLKGNEGSVGNPPPYETVKVLNILSEIFSYLSLSPWEK